LSTAYTIHWIFISFTNAARTCINSFGPVKIFLLRNKYFRFIYVLWTNYVQMLSGNERVMAFECGLRKHSFWEMKYKVGLFSGFFKLKWMSRDSIIWNFPMVFLNNWAPFFLKWFFESVKLVKDTYVLWEIGDEMGIAF
jgi:hypothetical protein